MRRVLLRTLVITGGCAAGILIGLSISDAAYANDRPQPLRNLLADVTDAVDNVLPDPKEPADKQPEPDAPVQPPARPVANLVEEVVDGVEDTVEGIADTISPPAAPVDDPTPGDVPDGAGEPTTPTVPVTTEPTPIVALGSASSPVDVGSETTNPGRMRNRYEADQASGDDNPARDAPWETLIRSLTGRPAPVLPDYGTPAQPLPPANPGHDATPSASTPQTPTTGADLPATLAARTSPPDTTAVRIPGRDLAADGMTSCPDAPSG